MPLDNGHYISVGDKCLGMLEAVGEVFPDEKYQRCIVHFYRNVFSVVPKSKVKTAEPEDPAADAGGRLLPGRKLSADAGLHQTASCGRIAVGQQKVHEHEASGGNAGRRLPCGLTSFTKAANIFAQLS